MGGRPHAYPRNAVSDRAEAPGLAGGAPGGSGCRRARHGAVLAGVERASGIYRRAGRANPRGAAQRHGSCAGFRSRLRAHRKDGSPADGNGVALLGDGGDRQRRRRAAAATRGSGQRDRTADSGGRMAAFRTGTTVPAAAFEPLDRFAFSPEPLATRYGKPHEMGTHGLWPGRPEYRSVFLLWGPGIGAGIFPRFRSWTFTRAFTRSSSRSEARPSRDFVVQRSRDVPRPSGFGHSGLRSF